jgi:2-(1,2-epoxy-1,2-dihydrophenyl)acetyl-CoA isomerase
MSEALVLSSDSESVRTLTLNRPASLNSFNAAMHEQLLRALDEAAEDASVRCVVLTGAGRAFSAGQDLADPGVAPASGPGSKPPDLGQLIDQFYKPLVQRMRSMPVPLLAAVNGVAAGAGANVALNCDLVIAAQSASFIQAFGKIGLIPDTGGTWLLPRLVGRARALGLAMLGDKLAAADAERIGLIWRCVADDELQAQSGALAQKLAAMPTKALVATRGCIDSAQLVGIDEALDTETATQRTLGQGDDYREGVTAFKDRRTPHFTDR